MDYFKILNLSREPFSNSPEPDFFFPSTRHIACLQQLELSIRLRRGLNVVMGDVGTGKTTLCRQLILRFSESEDDRIAVETHLLLDPSFSTPREFLSTVAMTFGLPKGDETKSEWQIKEGIKNYLFQKGVDENKTVVLIIDEGQKLPEFCLEILREFLNYETNENKLLQIVIFAQNEFKQTLKDHENFADRVNQYYFLGPLNFKETRTMIRFRLERAGRDAGSPFLFTLPGMWAIYRATGGYPRKIVTLCHQILLSLIIQNRVKAGWLMVRSTTGRLMPEMIRKDRWATAGVVAVLLVAVAGFVLFMPGAWDLPKTYFLSKQAVNEPAAPENPQVTAAAVPEKQQVTATAVPVEKPEAIRKAAATPSPEKPEVVRTAAATPMPKKPAAEGARPGQAPSPPDQLGRLQIRRGGTVLRLLREIYGSTETARFMAVIRANPQIHNIDWVLAGETIYFPAIKGRGNPLEEDKIWVQIAQANRLEEAYRLFKDYPENQPPIRLIPAWNPREGLRFTIVLKESFDSSAAAEVALRSLPPSLAKGAGIMEKPDNDTVYFAK